MTTLHDRETISIEKASTILGLGRSVAYRLANEGKLPGAFQLGRKWFVSLPALKEFLANPKKNLD